MLHYHCHWRLPSPSARKIDTHAYTTRFPKQMLYRTYEQSRVCVSQMPAHSSMCMSGIGVVAEEAGAAARKARDCEAIDSTDMRCPHAPPTRRSPASIRLSQTLSS